MGNNGRENIPLDRSFTNEEKQEALFLLSMMKYDYGKASDILEVPVSLLQEWVRTIDLRRPILLHLETTLEAMLRSVPENWAGADWAKALELLLDKYIVMVGGPTSITEVRSTESSTLNEKELDDILETARMILEGRALIMPQGDKDES